MIKFIIIFLIMTSMLFAGDSFMLQWNFYNFTVFFSIIFLIMLIPLYIIIALITRGRNSSSIFVKLFFIDIAIIIISLILLSIDDYKERNYIEHYNSHHLFQELKEHYGDDILVPGTEGLTILDMHTRMYSDTLYFLANDNTIYESIFDRTEPVVKIMELNNTRGFLFYSLSADEEIIYNSNTIVVYDNNNTVASYSLSYKNNKFIFDNNATERINRKLHLAKTKRKRDSILSYRLYIEMRPKIIKNRQELQFADATPFKVKYKPKSALKIFDTGYSGDKDDSLYVVYENKKGLYRLRNMANPENKQVQQKVKFLIEKAIVPKWRVPHTIFGVLYDKLTDYRSKKWIMPDVSSLNINQEKFDKLRILLLENPAIEYNYKLRVYNNHATVVVTSKEREDLRLLFRLTKEEDWKVDDFFISNKDVSKNMKLLGDIDDSKPKSGKINNSALEFYKKEFELYAKKFIVAKDKYDIFASRIKYALSLECMANSGDRYSLIGYGEKYMNRYASEMHMEKNLAKNIELLSANRYNFDMSDVVINKMFDENSTLWETETKIDEMYQLFVKRYIDEYITKNDRFPKEYMYEKFDKFKWIFYTKRKRWSGKFSKIKKENNVELIEKLIASDKNLNRKIVVDGRKIIPLMLAIKYNNLPLIQKLLDNGADMYCKPKNNYTSPLLTSVRQKKLDIVKLFISNGADVNYIEYKVLLLREAMGDLKMVKLLLDSGANPNLVDKYGRKLKEYYPCINKFNLAARKGCIKQEILLEAYGYTETREGIKKNIYDIAKTGKNINKFINIYEQKMSPMEISEYYLYDNNLTKMLAKNGANPYIRYNNRAYYLDPFLNTALHGNQNKLKQFISYGASLNYRYSDGNTAFMKFIKFDRCYHFKRVKILLDNGANPNLLDNNGCSLGDRIVKYCYPELQKKTIELLKKYDFDDTMKNCK